VNIIGYTEIGPGVVVVAVQDADGNVGYNTYNTDSSPRPVKTIIEIDEMPTEKWEWVD
jgi:hypothetical protein